MIVVEELAKIFKAKPEPVRAVDGISFTARPGTIFGLLGPNGAGKTTTLRILATLLKPTGGRASVNGHDVIGEPEAVRACLGYISGSTGIYDRLTAREMVRYAGRLQGLRGRSLEDRIEDLFRLFDLGEYADRPCGKLSTGNKQKVSLARAMVQDPPVLILDEPTSGLDILVARRVVQHIETLKSEGRTIILSTHIMSEVETLADEVAIIHHGRILAQGTLTQLEEQAQESSFSDAFYALIDQADQESPAPAGLS